MQITASIEQQQTKRIQTLRKSRDATHCHAALEEVRQAAETQTNLMPTIIKAVEANATVGEVADALRNVFGEYHEKN